MNYEKLTQPHIQFSERHIGPTVEQQTYMLNYLNCNTIEDLIQETVPKNILQKKHILQVDPCSEEEALFELKNILNKNLIWKSYLGQGYYNTHLPAVLQRNILENPSWYTSYTPYQPEIAQGRLEALLNYQQMIIDLTAMDIANASLLDEATAAAEAMTLCYRQSKTKSQKFFVDNNLHPQSIALLKTRAEPLGINLTIGDICFIDDNDYFGCVIQYPNTRGDITDWTDTISNLKDNDIIVAMATDLLALGMIKPPGEMDADIVFGSSQRFGIPLGYGGPHAAFFATKEKFKRSMPGRLIGVSKDTRGKLAYRLSLQTREQHIRREKATSNICTSQVLLAVLAGFYAVHHGSKGIKKIAERVHYLTKILYTGLSKQFSCNKQFFDTLTIKVGEQRDTVINKANLLETNLRKLDDDHITISIDETTTFENIIDLLIIFNIDTSDIKKILNDTESQNIGIPKFLQRTTSFLTHEVFNVYHTETELMRYIKKLESKDLSLTNSMIPLGSCTMKLNSAVEMQPVTWNVTSNIHPFVPKFQANGYTEMITQLCDWLKSLTGFTAISMQPNSGAQGEYAGLLAIRNYHLSQGNDHKNICLIPESAHGTNPASAQMCGMKVVVVKCDLDGNIDITDLDNKIQIHGDSVSALMITYPSTHGVFEENIKIICDKVHTIGAQVYMDGANLNALIGIAEPAEFGPDVMHFNLHKTFCIPHGGGGPGMGPIGVKKHLEHFLPNHPMDQTNSTCQGGAVSASPYGSPSILPISWMYIRMMGTKSLKMASMISILNANYLAERLNHYYYVLYRGKNGRLAHECIIDIRPIKQEVGITEEDIAKRLMDFGYHAPTMSWPVAGTLMIAPTASETLSELDRFCDAMLQISDEIEKIRNGDWALTNNPLVNAPHTQSDLVDQDWDTKFLYTRAQAVFPNNYVKNNKFWPSVNRIDNAHGDRNLVCSCPTIDEYE